MRRRLPLAALIPLLLLPAASARASHSQFSILQDDDAVLYGTGDARVTALGTMKALGADAVRITLQWEYVAGKKRGSYPAARWKRYDGAVRTARKVGLRVILDVTGPGPRWAMGKVNGPRAPRALTHAYKPNVALWAKFVRAAGVRYRKKVGAWEVWNEPGQPGWLTPQWARSKALGDKLIPYSPILYRGLYLAAHRALVATGHGTDAIYAGATSPLGEGRPSATTAMRPVPFIRELFCVKADGHRYTGKAAKARRCSELKGRFPMTAWAHHPYSRKVAPTVKDTRPNGITTANIAALPRLLDRIARATRLFKPGLPVLVDEYGFETNPPDPRKGISPAKQAEYLNVADHLLYRQPRVISTAQYLVRDAALNTRYKRTDRRRYSPYQSGLFFFDKKPKPALFAWMLPFTAERRGGAIAVWGQLRFRPDGTRGDRAQIQAQRSTGAPWTTVSEVPVTSARGFFTATVPDPGSTRLRAVWTGAQTPYEIDSRTVRLP